MEEEKTVEEIGEEASGGSGFSFGKLLAILLGVGLVLGVLYFLFVGNVQDDNYVEEPGVAEEVGMEDVEDFDNEVGVLFAMEEVALHSTADDCWIVIAGNVYDATPFIADAAHPGGAAILQGCGIDATELFETRPMGSGTPHSSSARGLLEGFYIGEVGEDIEDEFMEEDDVMTEEFPEDQIGM